MLKYPYLLHTLNEHSSSVKCVFKYTDCCLRLLCASKKRWSVDHLQLESCPQVQDQYSLPPNVSNSAAKLEYSLQQQPEGPACEVKYISLGSTYACIAATAGNGIATLNIALKDHLDSQLSQASPGECSIPFNDACLEHKLQSCMFNWQELVDFTYCTTTGIVVKLQE